MQVTAQKMVDRFLVVKKERDGVPEIKFNTRAIREVKKYNGVFVLVSNKEKDTFETLR